MIINTNKPIVIFDVESTGLDVAQDRIIEIGMLKISPNGTSIELVKRINPTIPISKESSEITGITDEDVKNEPTFKELANEIANFIGDADLVGYNSNKFDIPMLAEEFLRVDIHFDISKRKFIDVQNIFHKKEQRTLEAAYQFYCNKTLDNAHEAMADTKATYEVLLAQLEKYDDLEPNPEFLATFSKNTKHEIIDFAGRIAKNKEGKAIYNFGKHKGKTIEEIDKQEPGYYGWMLNSNFPLYTKEVLKKEMEKIKANRTQDKKDTSHSTSTAADMNAKLNALKSKFSKK